MGAQGTTTVNFGAAPGSFDTSVAVADASITGAALTEAWLYPVATAEHSVDEHIMATAGITVVAGAPSAGVGFTIYAVGDAGPFWGTFTVAYCWN